LIVVLPDGSPGTIQAGATDVLGEAPPAGPGTVLSTEGMQQLRELVILLTPAKRSTFRPKTRK